MTKPFSPELYRQHDHAAKCATMRFLAFVGYFPITAKEMYKDADICALWQNKTVFVECEVKTVWNKSGRWQGFKTVDVPYRKKDSKSNLFVMLNTHLDTLAVTLTANILQSPLTIKNTVYTSGELFFAVPVHCFKFYAVIGETFKLL